MYWYLFTSKLIVFTQFYIGNRYLLYHEIEPYVARGQLEKMAAADLRYQQKLHIAGTYQRMYRTLIPSGTLVEGTAVPGLMTFTHDGYRHASVLNKPGSLFSIVSRYKLKGSTYSETRMASVNNISENSLVYNFSERTAYAPISLHGLTLSFTPPFDLGARLQFDIDSLDGHHGGYQKLKVIMAGHFVDHWRRVQ